VDGLGVDLEVEDQIRLDYKREAGVMKLLTQGNSHGTVRLYQRMQKEMMIESEVKSEVVEVRSFE
tara:strand:- start:1395 stop:1589 length:195 start_codon:yes stop_codon:yes gene_type:complete